MRRRLRRGFLWVLQRTLNRLTVRLALAGLGPFSLVRHVGRRSGRPFETPLILAPTDGGFVAELTYGPTVNWYRNVVAAGRCEVVVGGVTYAIGAIEPLAPDAGLRAFRPAERVVLRLLRRHEFRLLRRV